MTETSFGFHVLEINMPLMGTSMGLLLLVGEAVLAVWWWVVKQMQAKKLCLLGDFHSQVPPTFEMGCRCHARRPYFQAPPTSSE